MKNTPIGTKTVRMEGFHLVQKLYSFLDIPSRRRFSASSFSFKRALDTGRVTAGNPSHCLGDALPGGSTVRARFVHGSFTARMKPNPNRPLSAGFLEQVRESGHPPKLGLSSVSISILCGVFTTPGDLLRLRKTPDLVSGFSLPRNRPKGPTQTFRDQSVKPARTTPQIEGFCQ